MTADAYIRSLIDQWERNMRTADEVVREIRTTLREEDEIRAAEQRERDILNRESFLYGTQEVN